MLRRLIVYPQAAVCIFHKLRKSIGENYVFKYSSGGFSIGNSNCINQFIPDLSGGFVKLLRRCVLLIIGNDSYADFLAV